MRHSDLKEAMAKDDQNDADRPRRPSGRRSVTRPRLRLPSWLSKSRSTCQYTILHTSITLIH